VISDRQCFVDGLAFNSRYIIEQKHPLNNGKSTKHVMLFHRTPLFLIYFVQRRTNLAAVLLYLPDEHYFRVEPFSKLKTYACRRLFFAHQVDGLMVFWLIKA